VFGFSNVNAASLRAGAAKMDITNYNSREIINDPIFAKALVLDDGKTKAVIITLDMIGVQSEFVSKVRKRIENELKIKGSNILINTSHNHHTQGQEAKDLVDRTVNAVKQAAQNMVSVKIGIGRGYENRITMNRRLILKNGKAWTIRRANPCPPDDEIAELGIFDPEIGILRIDKTNGQPLAVLYNFAGHAYCGVPNGGVTAEFPGFASEVIEKSLGSEAVALFLQGAAGDITTILYKDVSAPRSTEELGRMLGVSTLKALNGITMNKDASIKVVAENILLPVRTDVQEHIDSLEAQKEKILDFFTGIGCGSHGAGTSLNFKTFLPLYVKYALNPEFPSYYSYRYMQEKKIEKEELIRLDIQNKKDVQKYLASISNMDKLIRTLSNLQRLRNLQERLPDEPIPAEIQVMKIGEFVLVAFPGEVFAQIGLNIKKLSPHKNTFFSSYSNGSIGYAPTADAFGGDAYEDCSSRLSPEWQKIFEEKVLKIINEI